MRFERLSVGRYGQLSGWDTGPDPLSSLVLFHGPNESGKSTLFDCICSVLFGFTPANRESHPYSPWNGEHLEVDARVVLDDGTVFEVNRRLMSSPRTIVTAGAERIELGNRTLPPIEDLARSVFEHVYALGPGELGALTGDRRWDEVKDRLLGGNVATDLRSPRRVVEDTLREAQSFWRSDRRGSPAARELRETLTALNVARTRAAEADRELRESDRRRSAVAERLEAVQSERVRLEAQLEQATTLLGLSARVDRLRQLEERAGPEAARTGLSDDPVATYARLAHEEEEARRELGLLLEERRQLEAIAAGPGGPESRALALSDRIRRALGRREQLARDIEEARRAEGAATRAGELLAAEVPEIFERPWTELDPIGIARLPVEEVGSAVARLHDAEERVERALSSVETSPGPAAGKPRSAIRVAAGVFVLLLGLASLAVPGTGPTALGGALVSVGLAIVLFPLVRRVTPVLFDEGTRTADPRAALVEAEAAVHSAREALGLALDGLPVREEHLNSPPGNLAARLRAIRDAFSDRRLELERQRERLAAAEEARAEITDLARECGVPAGTPDELLDGLEALLGTGRTQQDAAQSAGRRLGTLTATEELRRTRLGELEAERAGLEARALAVGDGDLESGLRELRARSDAARKADDHRAELAREGIDPAEVETRIAALSGEENPLLEDPARIPAARARRDELAEESNRLSTELGALNRAIDGPQVERGLADVEGEIEAATEALRAAELEHDRLHVIASLIREADRRFREEHQPDVVRRAQGYIRTLTGGRYDRLLAQEGERGDEFVLRGRGAPAGEAAEGPLSTGTREQAYLALRIAAIAHLDADGERLPLVFDEVFANWDATRRARGLELLIEVSGERQVLLFTCHDPLAEEAAALGAQVIRLADPP